MEYRKLGKSGLQISALSFGSWVTFDRQVNELLATELMAYAYEQGINFFDNAEVYANGHSEIIMGRVLKNLKWDRSSYLISSKAYFGRGDKRPNMTGLSRKHLFEACHEALSRLQLDYIDLFFAHRPDKKTPMEEVVWTMHQLILQGKILYWGTSEWSAQEIMEAHMVARENHLIAPIVEQAQYNMLNRVKIEVEFNQIYNTVGLGTTIWSPLASGLLTGKYTENSIPEDSRLHLAEYAWLKEKTLTSENLEIIRQLNDFILDSGITLSQLSIAWCLLNQRVSSVILGATKLSQLKENLKSLDLISFFNEANIEKLESILKNKPKAPVY
ncbi:MAG: aldo/keto reductase [Saprospiraceae bacterium]|nr:aldo/keto reductase [Saprospiraceae bacterium]